MEAGLLGNRFFQYKFHFRRYRYQLKEHSMASYKEDLTESTQLEILEIRFFWKITALLTTRNAKCRHRKQIYVTSTRSCTFTLTHFQCTFFERCNWLMIFAKLNVVAWFKTKSAIQFQNIALYSLTHWVFYQLVYLMFFFYDNKIL